MRESENTRNTILSESFKTFRDQDGQREMVDLRASSIKKQIGHNLHRNSTINSGRCGISLLEMIFFIF